MRASLPSTIATPSSNAIIWRDDDGRAAAGAAEADRRLASRRATAPFLGVPLPIKDLTPVAGWPVTYGSRGAPDWAERARASSVVDALVTMPASCSAGARTPRSSA